MKKRGISLLGLVLTTACGARSPLAPSPPGPPIPLALEAEAATGGGFPLQRSRASGGQTVHLAPGESRRWTIPLDAADADYLLSVTYSNSRWGEREVLTMTVNGAVLGSRQVSDSGEGEEGWNVFVSDPAGGSRLGRGSHTVVISSSGGDGCVEIDKVTLTPAGAGAASDK